MINGSISGLSSSYSIASNSDNDPRKDFKALSDALQSGDLDAAKKAYASIKEHMPQKSSTTANSAADQFTKQFDALGKALDSGDLKAAQTAFQSLQNDKKTHHHHHRPNTDQTANTTSEPQTVNADGSTLSISA